MTRTDGGSAFPHGAEASGVYQNTSGGMSLRDWFASQAPPMPDSVWGSAGPINLADDSTRAAYLAVMALWRYEFADAMLEQRENHD